MAGTRELGLFIAGQGIDRGIGELAKMVAAKKAKVGPINTDNLVNAIVGGGSMAASYMYGRRLPADVDTIVAIAGAGRLVDGILGIVRNQVMGGGKTEAVTISRSSPKTKSKSSRSFTK